MRFLTFRFSTLISLVLWLPVLALKGQANAQPSPLQWHAREDLNILLPPSVRIFETCGQLEDGSPVRAMYATIDLRDNNLRLRAIGSNALRETTKDTYDRHNAILAINGGYFSATKSESVLVSDGEIIAPGPRNFTRGAFGLVNRIPQIVWPYVDSVQNIYQLSDPVDMQKLKQAERFKKLKPWHPSQVVGAGPVLIKDGKIRDTSIEEGFGASHLIRHPRSAIGYKDKHTLVMMVVDGRQQSSAGVTITELARLMFDVGCYEAVNLDGGGSSAMVAADEVVNVPVDLPNGNRHSLRRNASALILTEEIPSISKDVIVIDTDSKHYTETGIWKNTNHTNYYGASPSRQAQATTYNRALYHFKNLKPGNFQLAAWWTIHEDNSNLITYVLHRGRKIDSLSTDQTRINSNGRWNVLGSYHLADGDFLEVISNSKEKNLVTDAIRLVRVNEVLHDPRRGDLRVAVISDLNSGLGSATYEWQVDSIMRRIPANWNPDLVLCGGDMVAGMGVSDTATLTKMWKGFTEHIFAPLKKSQIPFAFTIGNHDGLRSYPAERKAIEDYWRQPQNDTRLAFVDKTHFPNYYSFKSGEAFFVSWDASSSEITDENLTWLRSQFETPEAKQAKMRFVVGHLPMYSVAQERDSKGNVLEAGDDLRKLLESYNVKVYVSGHQHAYFPGKRGKLQLLNSGAAGSGARRWLTTDLAPVNTITIMDVFFDRDTIAYTTYDIKEKAAKDMKVFDHKILPASVSGVNGNILRNDIAVVNKASGIFFRADSHLTRAFGKVAVQIVNNAVSVTGDFVSEGKLLKASDAITFELGRNSEPGKTVFAIPAKIKNGKNGTIAASFDATEGMDELLSAGAYRIIVRTEKFPQGELRAQLYSMKNSAPDQPTIQTHSSQHTYGIRDSNGLYRIGWNEGQDPDGDNVTYTYQLATDSLFNTVVLQETTARINFIKKPEQTFYNLLRKKDEGAAQTFYHRVIATDGLHQSISKTSALALMKSNEPLRDFIELDPETYVFEGKIENTGGQGSGATFDKVGNLWLADYGGTLYAKTPAGKDLSFSPIRSVTINNKSYSLKPINGIGLDLDGNILVGCNRFLLKINASTGEGIAVWEAPEGKRAITSPRVSSNGEIYAMSLFAEDPNYVLRQSAITPGAFDLVRTITLPQRILARTFDMSSDGLTLYFPDPGSAIIQRFISSDGKTYKRMEDLTSTAAGCNAVDVAGAKLFATVRSSGVAGATLHMRDEKQKFMWTLPLAELDGAEARGMAVSEDQRVVIICAWDKGGGFYKYTLR